MSNDGQKAEGLEELLGTGGFWGLRQGSGEVRGSLDRLARGMVPVLKRLGPTPFNKTRFPVVGFLETVYEHIGEHARGRLPAEKVG